MKSNGLQKHNNWDQKQKCVSGVLKVTQKGVFRLFCTKSK